MVARLWVLAPELVLAAAAVLVTGVLLMQSPGRGRVVRRAVVAGLLIAAVAAVATVMAGAGDEFLFGAYRIDAFSQVTKAMVLALALVAHVAGRADDGQWKDARGEAMQFGTLSVAGLVGAVSAADLLLLVLLLEVSTLAFIALVASGGRRALAESPARRVFVSHLGALVVLLAGALLVAAAAGSTRLDDVALAFAAGPPEPAASLGAALLLAGLCGALAVPPAHASAMAVQSEAAPGAAVLGAAALWLGSAMILIRTAAVVAGAHPVVRWGLAGAGTAIMVLSAVAAWRAVALRAACGWLAAAQGGVLLLGLATGTRPGWAAAALAAVASGLAVAILGLALARLAHDRGALMRTDLDALAGHHPSVGIAVAIALAALAGCPLTAGYAGRAATSAALWLDGPRPAVVGFVAGSIALAIATVPLLLRIMRRPGARRPRQPLLRGDRWLFAALAAAVVAVGLAAPLFHRSGVLATFLV